MQTDVARKRFTVDEYYTMLETGILHEGDRVELIDGEILQMSSMGARHAATVYRIDVTLKQACGKRALVRSQLPFHVNDFSEPEPDIAVVRYRADSYGSAHPEPADILFLIEITDTTLQFDQNVKLPIYAEASIPEVWIVDLNSEVVSVYREPDRSKYRLRTDLVRDDTASPLAFPDLSLDVSQILF